MIEVTPQDLLGERIVLLRRRRHWTQPELAAKVGMGVTTLNRLENGHQSISMKNLIPLVRALGTTADYLLGLSEKPEKDTETEPATLAVA